MSKGFMDVERNYEVYDKEMLAIVRALEEWWHFIQGAEEKVDIYTDHCNSGYFHTAQRLNWCQARWSLFLSQFHFTLTHHPGKLMGKPDALSCCADHLKGKDDNEGLTLLQPAWFEARAVEVVLIEGEEAGILERIHMAKDHDEKVVKAMWELGEGTVRSGEWEKQGELVLHRGKVYVPKDPQLRHDLVWLHHDARVTGHLGRWKTLELVSCDYWWPQMAEYVGWYVRGCDTCNRIMSFPSQKVGKLIPNKVPTHRWQVISVDMVGSFPSPRATTPSSS
jgi:hypothetical protein